MRIINYTNVCVAQCDYCAFYVLPEPGRAATCSRARTCSRRSTSWSRSAATWSAFNGGFNPKLPLDYYCDLFRVRARALRRAGRVLRADGGRVRVPRRPRRALVRGRGCAPARRGRPLGHRRRQRDPHRGLPQAARQVEVHGRRLLRGAAGDRRERDAHDRDDGDRLRRDARRAARAPAADARLPGRRLRTGTRGSSRSSAGRTSRTGRRSAARRSRRDEYRRWIALSAGSSSTTSSTSGRRC